MIRGSLGVRLDLLTCVDFGREADRTDVSGSHGVRLDLLTIP